MRADLGPERRERIEHLTRRVIGVSFLALAAYVGAESLRALWLGERPDASPVGTALLTASVIVMPALARAKRRVARAIGSASREADATQTSLCAWLSAIALAGIALNAFVGWWWADPVAALAMVPIIVREGVEGVRGKECADRCDH